MKFEGEANYVKNIASVTASLNQKCLDALKKVKIEDEKSDNEDNEDVTKGETSISND